MDAPRALKAGDTIGIAAPSSPFDRKRFTKGVHILEKMGFDISYRHDIFDQNRYLAGTDERRAQEFTELFTDKNISAIMFARGGYGSQRIIPLLDADYLRKHPKPVIGFSDVTALLSFLNQNAEVPTFYGPVVTQLGRSKSEITPKAFLTALTTPGALGNIPVDGARTLRSGDAEGTLVGGCLSLINSSIGTNYEVDTKDRVLFIEEIGEKVYVLDRMLTQLKNGNKLRDVRGIIFGSLIPPEDEPHDIETMIMDVLSDFNGPIVMDFPAGHIDDFVTLPLGASVSLNACENDQPSLIYTSGLLE
ncbi:MAG: LD-carboxypeptidase [Deltaproteobacteria bacterium]|jgi:muramoyltetrapeptide carboxypeptidase|nr:LD-carboxypeptidase [Deltaproteobacteria bacterium]